MRLPPLRLHYYGIRLRIVLYALSTILIFFSPLLVGLKQIDIYSVLLFFLIIANFSFGFHEYHTTSQSYLALRNHRRSFFLSSTLLGVCGAILAMMIALGYMLFYEGTPSSAILISSLVFPMLIFFFSYILGCLFAIIFHQRWIQLLLLGMLLIFSTLFYEPIWAGRHQLQLMMIALPAHFTSSIIFFYLIGVVVIPSFLLALLNYIVYTKKR